MLKLSSWAVAAAMSVVLFAPALPRAHTAGPPRQAPVSSVRPVSARVSTLVAEAEKLTQALRFAEAQTRSDGIVGLTRGFFYAGTPSVMATFWAVADETTAILMSGFYRNYVRDRGKSVSLRAAQLALLADLRAGRVVVAASDRRVTLPEHPLLWAAFFLSGEP